MPQARAVLLMYGALALFVTPVFPHFLSPNEFSRWAVAASVVERGTFEISWLSPLPGPGFEDVSARGGRLYANKAPGLAAVAVPGYLAARPAAGPPAREGMRLSLTAMRLVGSTLPALLLGLVFARTAERFGGDPSRVAASLFALLFATPLFAYGLLLFSHTLAAAGLFGAWAALFIPAGPKSAARGEALAGALLGLAVVSEVAAWRRGTQPLGQLGILLAVLGTLWVAASALLFTLFASAPLRGPVEFLRYAVVEQGDLLFTLWAILGGLGVAIVFSLTAVSPPLLLGRRVGLRQALLTSARAVGENPVAMLLWALVILIATSLSLATAMLGFLVTVPVVGHASWHAYRDLVDAEGAPLRNP